MAVNGTRMIAGAFALWLVWTFSTWWFEGRIGTFSRPDAITDRLVYTIVSNVLVGVVGAAFVLRMLLRAADAGGESAGFGPPWRTLIAVPVGAALGLALYFGQGAPSANPTVLLNAYSQVFVVSMAEVVVCWSLVGGIVAVSLRGSGWISVAVALIAASLLFGVYHFAHSAPFNTVPMVAFLTAIGLLTGAFFFVSRDVYGTVVFHNFLGMFGVVQALAAQNALTAFETPQIPLIATAAVALGVLIVVDAAVIRSGLKDGGPGPSPT